MYREPNPAATMIAWYEPLTRLYAELVHEPLQPDQAVELLRYAAGVDFDLKGDRHAAPEHMLRGHELTHEHMQALAFTCEELMARLYGMSESGTDFDARDLGAGLVASFVLSEIESRDPGRMPESWFKYITAFARTWQQRVSADDFLEFHWWIIRGLGDRRFERTLPE